MAYLSLFGFSFLAATLLPFSSELVLLGLLAAGHDPMGLWLAATAGNTLGAVVNWALGRFFLHYRQRSWFPFRDTQLTRYQHWFARYGQWSLLFAWLPLVGDALTFAAGVMRIHWLPFVLLTGLGKALRYWLVIVAAV